MINLSMISKKHFKSSVLFTMAFTFGLSFVMAVPASALSESMKEFYNDSNAPFFRPDATYSSGACGEPGSVELRGNSNAEQIWNFLVDKGLSPEQAAGVMGNLRQESNYEPDAKEGNGIGYGIAQWSFSRRDTLEAKAKDAGVPVSDLGFQLEFMYAEASERPAIRGGGSEWEVLQRQSTIEDALVFWHDSYERSADTRSEVIERRGGYAQDAFASFAGGSSAAADSSCTDITGLDGSQQAIQDLAKQYAWPEYHSAPYTYQTAEYSKAVSVAASEGRFLGGNGGNGNDCGGFVTTIVYDSGIDKNYNYQKGNTTVQKQYLDANWEKLGTGSTINVADLQPGDVAIYPGHTYIYVGDIGFESKWVSASVGGPRSPMAGKENPTSADTSWYRMKPFVPDGASLE